MNFSQRIGLEPSIKPFQKDSMDRELRNSLWNAFEICFLPSLERSWYSSFSSRAGISATLLVSLWADFYKFPLHTLPSGAEDAVNMVRKLFFDEANVPWNKVYDFVQFIANLGDPLRREANNFREYCQQVLKREFSAYRFVDKTLAPITNDAEIMAIEEASKDDSLLRPVSTHIDTALKLLTDKEKPDYRNSMKESISAVEALCKIVAPNTKTLGPALDAVTLKVGLHPDLQKGFKALYGYTSDTHGIRHVLKDDKEPEQEDATYMLVSCSAFVNYLAEKTRKHGLLPP